MGNLFIKTYIPILFLLLVVSVLPVVTMAAEDSPLVPCGTETYEASDIKPEGKYTGDIKNPCGFGDFITLVNNITTFLIILGASFSAVAFGYAGFLMMTAHGEMGKIEEAKAIFGKVLVGFLFMLSAWLIVHALEAAFLDETEFKSFLS